MFHCNTNDSAELLFHCARLTWAETCENWNRNDGDSGKAMWCRFFGTFALVAMEHVSEAVHFFQYSSEQLMLLNARFLSFFHGIGSEWLLHGLPKRWFGSEGPSWEGGGVASVSLSEEVIGYQGQGHGAPRGWCQDTTEGMMSRERRAVTRGVEPCPQRGGIALSNRKRRLEVKSCETTLLLWKAYWKSFSWAEWWRKTTVRGQARFYFCVTNKESLFLQTKAEMTKMTFFFFRFRYHSSASFFWPLEDFRQKVGNGFLPRPGLGRFLGLIPCPVPSRG